MRSYESIGEMKKLFMIEFRSVTKVLCDRRKLMSKFYSAVIKPIQIYVIKYWTTKILTYTHK